MALRMLDVPADDPALVRARSFILARGGISSTRIFTKMHLALIGAYDWAGLPSLPPLLMMLPDRSPFSIYEFSSWARGSTVPLIAVFDRKPVYSPLLNLDASTPRAAVTCASSCRAPRMPSRRSSSCSTVSRARRAQRHRPVSPGRHRARGTVDGAAPRGHRRLGRHHSGDAQRDARAARARLRRARSGGRARLVGARRLYDRRRGFVPRAAVHLTGLGHRPRGARAGRRRRAAHRQTAARSGQLAARETDRRDVR